MKRLITAIAAIIFTSTSYGQVQLYLGLRGGAGAMFSHEQLTGLTSAQGFQNAFEFNKTYSAHAKAELLLGFRRLRIGYRFMYNFSGPDVNTAVSYFSDDHARAATYYNNSQSHFFAHYLVLELAIINLPHFALVPGIAGGTYTGFKVDNTYGDNVPLSSSTHHRFTVGAELNAEIKFGRTSLILGPSYYLFCLQDKANSDWREYQHSLGGDIGLRFSLIKPKASKQQ